MIVELRLRADRSGYVPATVQLHGLACALFEAVYSASHDAQEKPFSVWPLALARRLAATRNLACRRLPAVRSHRVRPAQHRPATCAVTDLALRLASFTELAAGQPGAAVWPDFRSPT